MLNDKEQNSVQIEFFFFFFLLRRSLKYKEICKLYNAKIESKWESEFLKIKLWQTENTDYKKKILRDKCISSKNLLTYRNGSNLASNTHFKKCNFK